MALTAAEQMEEQKLKNELERSILDFVSKHNIDLKTMIKILVEITYFWSRRL